jgi:hypothetical protein
MEMGRQFGDLRTVVEPRIRPSEARETGRCVIGLSYQEACRVGLEHLHPLHGSPFAAGKGGSPDPPKGSNLNLAAAMNRRLREEREKGGED